MKFTIVTPVLNGGAYLSQTIASLLAQGEKSYEHLIVDGGSTDETLDIIARSSSKDSRIRLISAPGLGQYAAIDKGFGEAQGRWLAWLNADDLYAPWALARVGRVFESADRPQWVSGQPACWDQAGVLAFIRPCGAAPRSLIAQGWFHKDLLGFLQQEAMFFSACLYQAMNDDERSAFIRARLAGDFLLWRAFARHTDLSFVPSVLGGFRRHENNRSVSGMDDYMKEVRDSGARFLPGPLTHLARALYQFYSARQLRQLLANA